ERDDRTGFYFTGSLRLTVDRTCLLTEWSLDRVIRLNRAHQLSQSGSLLLRLYSVNRTDIVESGHVATAWQLHPRARLVSEFDLTRRIGLAERFLICHLPQAATLQLVIGLRTHNQFKSDIISSLVHLPDPSQGTSCHNFLDLKN
ncbi:hypothetical protein Ciccas_008515, partial [Cichlidogyrus casuarinus]